MDTSVNVIERAQTPRGELQLQRRGNHYEIISNGVFLMATYNGESERLLVNAAVEETPATKRMVIGGLGVGFSLEAALQSSSIQEVKVIEIEPKIVEWNERYLNLLSNNSLQDPRTNIIQADLLEWIWQDEGGYDAICLDIDNGPDWTVTDSNNALYQTGSLVRLAKMLHPQGVVTFWSASHSLAFQRLLKGVFSKVSIKKVPQEKGEDDCIYVAVEPFL